MLDCQRIRAGKRLPLEIVEYRMNDVVDEVVAEMRRQHGDRFVVHAEPDVSGYWSWDAMRRALENLLTNAVKYSDPQSPITITLKVGEGNRMSLSVHNNGPTLSAEEQARIFLPFERSKSAERSGKAGWGIGLTLVQGIVDGHGGTVSVESSPERGTTFHINNPMDSRPYQGEEQA
jgi:signal transduction histidine kinase